MGAWGIQPFENDGAGDLEAELCYGEPGDLRPLEEAFAAALGGEYLEIDAGQAAVAAAAIVARLAGAGQIEVPAGVLDWFREAPEHGAAALVPEARQALQAVAAHPAGSELSELWQETDEFEAWRQSVAKIAGALAGLG